VYLFSSHITSEVCFTVYYNSCWLWFCCSISINASTNARCWGCFLTDAQSDAWGYWGTLHGCSMGRVGRGPRQNFGEMGHNAFNQSMIYLGPTSWPVCSLIIRKISIIGAAGCQILRLKIKCTKFTFRYLPQTPLRDTALPKPSSCI